MSVTKRIKKLEQKIGGECFAVIAREDWATDDKTGEQTLQGLFFTVNGQDLELTRADSEAEAQLRRRAWDTAKEANGGCPVFLLNPVVKLL